jgi:hypothetical protein
MDETKLSAELLHHERIARIANKGYLEKKRKFWESVLELVKKHSGGVVSTPVLEIGNGPFGAFLALKSGETYCVDPLNDRYKDLFPHLRRIKNATFISGEVESLDSVPPARTVICYNALDHMDEPAAARSGMFRLAADDATVLVGVDYYGNWLIKMFVHAFRRHIDAPHPQHFSIDDLRRLFAERFEIIEVTDTSGFRFFPEDPPPEDENALVRIRKRPLPALAGILYGLAYYFGKKAGMGGKEPNLGIKRTAVFVMRKRQRRSAGYDDIRRIA